MNLHSLAEYDVIIDVRSPREFGASHIPGAVNLPVLSDKEHEQIGALYRINPLAATYKGAAFACANIAQMLENRSNILAYQHKIAIYCARGGQRSLALHSVLNAMNLRATRIPGGYKTYRHAVLDFLESDAIKKRSFITLCGNTGSGKSEIIRLGSAWSVDLENIANHYGSVFGFLAGVQPSAKMFQNRLAHEFCAKKSPKILIENESKKIGALIVPSALYNAYQNGIMVLVECSLESRIKRISALYKNISERDFLRCLGIVSPYISRALKGEILAFWERGELESVAERLLVGYYDKVYRQPRCSVRIKSDNIAAAYENIKNL